METKLTDCSINKGWVTSNESGQAFNKLSPAESERLDVLAEECAEVIQAICKIKRHGYESRHPSGGPSNRTQLEIELGDVRWAMLQLTGGGDIKLNSILEAYRCKCDRPQKYLHHQGPSYRETIGGGA